MRRLLNSLLAFLDRWQQAGHVRMGADTERAERELAEQVQIAKDEHRTTAYWQDAIKHATSQAFQAGHVQGELYGRRTLAAELEAQFTPEGAREFGPEEARTVALKQLH